MSYKNGKSYTDFRAINLKAQNGCIRFEDADTAPTSTTGEYLMYVDGGVLYYDNGSSAVALSGGGGGSSSLDGAYDIGRTITVNQGSVVMNGATETTAVLSLTGDGASSGALLALAHTTATRNDILGTGSTWAVTGQGKATFVQAAVPTIVSATSGNTALTINAAGTGTIGIGSVSTGAVTITPALTAVASVTITGSAGSNILTLTAGDAVLSDGSVDITDADNAASLAVTNSAATTIGAAAAGGVVQLDCASLTTGALLSLELTEGTLNGGWYVRAWDVTGSTAVWTVGEDGNMTISGTASGTDAITITAGDITMTSGDLTLTSGALVMTVGDASLVDGSLTIADADNAASLSVTNNTATSASPIVFAGSGVFTGSTTSSFMTVTPSGLTTGTAVYLPVAAMTTGKGLHIAAGAMTSGTAIYVSATEATLTTGKYLEFYDGAANDFSVAKYGATVIAGNATGTDALTITAGDITLTNGDVTLTDGDVILTANSSLITFTGTGANGGVLKNLKNQAASTLSGTELEVEIDIGGTPYYFKVYPTTT